MCVCLLEWRGRRFFVHKTVINQFPSVLGGKWKNEYSCSPLSFLLEPFTHSADFLHCFSSFAAPPSALRNNKEKEGDKKIRQFGIDRSSGASGRLGNGVIEIAWSIRTKNARLLWCGAFILKMHGYVLDCCSRYFAELTIRAAMQRSSKCRIELTPNFNWVRDVKQSSGLPD